MAELITSQYCIVGAGPAGLQLGFHMQQANRSYVIIERAGEPGAFFRTYPRHRQLISINKRYTGHEEDLPKRNPEFNLRHDWNSLLTASPPGGAAAGSKRFANFSKDYFPHADTIVDYLAYYASEHELNVLYSTEVTEVANVADPTGLSESGFKLTHSMGSTLCRSVIVATGLSVPHSPIKDPSGIVEQYDSMPIDPESYEGQDVLIIGRGNAALETANHIYGHTARVNVISSSRVKLSWETHYVGNVRGVNNEIMDSCESSDRAPRTRAMSSLGRRRPETLSTLTVCPS